MTDQPNLFDNLDRQVQAATPDRLIPDAADPKAELWWRPVKIEIVKVSGGRL